MQHEDLINYIEQYITLSDADKQIICDSYKVMHLDKKEFLFHQGDRCETEAFVLNGTLRVFYSDDKGNEHVLNFALPTWWVGDITSFYEGSPAFMSVQALEPSELLVIRPEQKEELFKKIPALERMFRIIIQKHLTSYQNRFLAAISKTADERYMNLLARIPNIEQLVPQHQIASYLGILPESLSRLKRKLIEAKK